MNESFIITYHCSWFMFWQSVVTMDGDRCSCSIVNPTDNSAPPKTFTFDGVYGENSTTEQIYNESAYPLIEVICFSDRKELIYNPLTE